ncbi:MAG TPA: Ku protein [Mycobacteriales bacterium]|jgi:DNA end-binding protein Ku|nr:Ku protein [Mycobacteriales bacterium]
MQSVWKGVISFGLVSIPVQLFAATEEHSVSFRQIHVSDGGQVRYRRVCTLDGEEIPYGDIARGYELPDGHVVVLTDEDFAQLPLATSRAIEVLGFADADSVDPVRLSRSYYCDATGSDTKAYVLLREALRRTGKVALVKVALRGRESPAVLHPRDGVLVLHLLLWQDEVRTPRFPFRQDETPPRPRELAAAEAYIHTLTGTAEPAEMVDRYQAALRELVEAKVAGRQLEQPATPTPVHSTEALMEALRRSVEQAKHDRGDAVPAKKRKLPAAPAKKTTAKKPAARRAGKNG